MSTESDANDIYFVPASNMQLTIPEEKAASVTSSQKYYKPSIALHVGNLPRPEDISYYQSILSPTASSVHQDTSQTCPLDPLDDKKAVETLLNENQIESVSSGATSVIGSNAEGKTYSAEGTLISSIVDTVTQGKCSVTVNVVPRKFPKTQTSHSQTEIKPNCPFYEEDEEDEEEDEGEDEEEDEGEDEEDEEDEGENELKENYFDSSHQQAQDSSDRIDRAHRSKNNQVPLSDLKVGDSSTSHSNDRRSASDEGEDNVCYPTQMHFDNQEVSEDETEVGIDFLVEKTDQLELAARNTDIPKENKHLHIDLWSPNTIAFSADTINMRLGVPISAISILHKDKCVIAGGAALYLACPWTKWTHRCDVDFFVFDTQEAEDIMLRLCEILQQQSYVICQSSKSVLTAIGYYGMRKIQIIRSGAKKVDDLISGEHGFDIDAVKAYYDGTVLCGSLNAETNWRARKCTTYTYRYVEPVRLYGMLWKGFTLPDECIRHIKNTLSWPLSDKFIADYENNIVCLNRELPAQVQEQQLKLMHLPVVNNLQEIIEAMDCKQNDYIKIFTFAGTYEEYTKDCIVETRGSKIARIQACRENNWKAENYPGTFYSLTTGYDLRLPLCRILWKVNLLSKDKHERSLGRVEVCNAAEHIKLIQMESTWYSEIKQKNSHVSRFDSTHARVIDDKGNTVPTTNINVKLTNKTKFYVNGVRAQVNVLLPRTHVSLVAYPDYFYDNCHMCRLIWKIKKIFIVKQD